VTVTRPRKWILWGLGLAFFCAALAVVIFPALAPPTLYTNEMAARADLGGLLQALEAFKKDHGRYPTPDESLDALIDPSPGRGYVISRHAITDPWGHVFVYRAPGPKQEGGLMVYSRGPNGIDEGGAGDDIVPRDEK
jgi:general secretion pathway protein G